LALPGCALMAADRSDPADAWDRTRPDAAACAIGR
jgi:hypothetical protein